MWSLFLSWLLLGNINYKELGHSCDIPEGDRQLLLAKVKDQIMQALGSPPTPSTSSPPTPPSPNPQGTIQRAIYKRHSRRHPENMEDASQLILFPSSDVPCEITNLEDTQETSGTSFTYVFRPSPYIRTRRVSATQLWFFTSAPKANHSSLFENTSETRHLGIVPSLDSQENQPPTRGPSAQHHNQVTTAPAYVNSSRDDDDDDDDDIPQTSVELQVLSEHEAIIVPPSKVQQVDDWTVFHLAPAFLNYVTREIFVLLVQCSTCPCSHRPEHTPFLMYSTLPAQRNRRSGMPWSPSALDLLQRPPASGAGNDHCHRGSLNISFEELGWDQWIVHPVGFQFHYCHGTCSVNHELTPTLHWGHCCAALPTTMKSLRVTTTTDGGFTYRYETVPNLLTQDCACS